MTATSKTRTLACIVTTTTYRIVLSLYSSFLLDDITVAVIATMLMAEAELTSPVQTFSLDSNAR
jgi:hypothetical protein